MKPKFASLITLFISVLIAVFGGETFAKETFQLKGSSISLSEGHVEIHPGIVYFKEVVPFKNTPTMVFVQRVAFFCGSRQVFAQGGSAHSTKDLTPGTDVAVDTVDMQLDRFDNNDRLIQTLESKCSRPLSKKNLELPLASSNNGTYFWLTKTTSTYGNEVSLWLRYVKTRTEERVKGFPEVVLNDGSLLAFHTFDCSRRRSKRIQLIEYSGAEGSPAVDNTELPWSPVVPNTIFEAAFERVCSNYFSPR